MLLEGLLFHKCLVASGISRGKNTSFAFVQPRDYARHLLCKRDFRTKECANVMHTVRV